ncbi:hypothetical protein M0805_001521 [Coniferiporia weirii]|nr:hypothetical protein M0805_001521 [Coniferiporia weirii]
MFHRPLTQVYEHQPSPQRRATHKQNKSLLSTVTFSAHPDKQHRASLGFASLYATLPTRARTLSSPAPRSSTARSFPDSLQDKPLPPPPLPEPPMPESQKDEDSEIDADTLRGQRLSGSVSDAGEDQRDDLSTGSWLDSEDALEPEDVVTSSFDLDDYLSRPAPSSPSPQPSTTTERPARRSFAPMLSGSPPFGPRSADFLDFSDTTSKPHPDAGTAFVRPTPIQTDPRSLANPGLARSKSESEHLYDFTPPLFARPRMSGLPDPSNFPDPYPRGMSFNHPPSATPALSSAGSASTRSSAYTNPGSTISGVGFSGDYSHVRVASGDDIDGAHGVDSTVELPTRASTGSSLSSGSRKSHGHVHAVPTQMSRLRRSDYARSARSPSQSDDIVPPPIPYADLPHPLRTQPSYDTSWQREHEHDEFATSEEEYDYGDQQDGEDDEDEKEEGEPGSAIIVAEEGRGLIVHGEGLSVHSLTIQSGVTHLLVGGSSTPNSVPAFLTTTLPQISTTLLALDISANFLASLSPALGLCSSLEELNISANPLRVLPEFLAELTSLRLLIADSTGISTIPTPLSALEKLHTLSIRRNKMHALPSWLCTLPCLESLLVDGNPFQGPWKALVEPLLAKVPMTPAYPPSTPMIPQLSATFSTLSNTTTIESTDVSEAEDYTDQDDASPPASGVPIPYTNVGLASSDANLEEDTITPGRASLLGRSVTVPAPHVASFSPPLPSSLSRTRTTPNRSYYERERQQREQIVSPSSTLTWAGDESDQLDTPNTNATGDSTPDLMRLGSQTTRGELRRMHSADELRRAMQPTGGVRPMPIEESPAATVSGALPPSPPRPQLPHYVTSSQAARLRDNMDAQSQQRRFATLSSHTRTPSRSSVRPAVQSLWDGPAPEEECDADIESPPRPNARARAATSVNRRERPSRDEEYDQSSRRSLVKPKAEKEKSSRKWGFLKKMSMGKLKSTDGASSPPSSSSRPSTSQGLLSMAGSSASGPTVPTSVSAAPRQLSSFQVEVDASVASNNSPPAGFPPPPSFSLHQSPIPQNASTDKLRIPPTPTTPLSAGLLAPPSPMSKSSKRRSFLPIDGPPALNIPIPNTSPFLGGLTATNGCDDIDDASRQPSPIPDSLQDLLRKEEDRNREANTRALRSVMAYLKDMNDLTLLSQGSVLSMYGGSLPLMDRSRRPTLVDGGRMQSETSVDSMDSASSAPTTASSHLRSLDSLTGDRSGSLNTMSIATTDSSGSGGEERKCKDDRGKRVMIVREIVETERTYVKNLQGLVDIYVRPAATPVSSISNVTSSSKETVVPAAERKVVFGNLEALFIFHKESFLPALEAAAAPLFTPQGTAADAESGGKISSDVAMSVGRTFIAHAAFMKMYSSYINNFENSVSRIRQWVSDRSGPTPGSGTLSPSSSTAHLANIAISMSAMSSPNPGVTDGMMTGKVVLSSGQRKRIKTYLKRCKMNPKHSQLNLEGYLLLPVQRIPRYRLLLDELVRSTPPPSDSFDDPLDRALTEISSLATNMNEGKREAESRRRLVQWQSRIRGKFPSPLVQPHRRLIMDGKLLLTRIVRKQTMAFEVLDSHGDSSSVAVDCLAPELTPRPLYGVLCNDLFVLCRDPSNGKDPNSPVDLWAVLRMQTMPQPTSVVHTNTLRIVDTKAILYLEAPSAPEALTWFRAINMHVPSQRLDA